MKNIDLIITGNPLGYFFLTIGIMILVACLCF